MGAIPVSARLQETDSLAAGEHACAENCLAAAQVCERCVDESLGDGVMERRVQQCREAAARFQKEGVSWVARRLSSASRATNVSAPEISRSDARIFA